ncbi:ATP-dependent sacrificial sulfur transferase LarE [Romboutsia sp.]|uniref:ATP-dependent sacrificial sulfur transferase LarE n=1 Tax=Romboutsia sp. TaxID=1965302 RepID=UPI003F30A68B
MELSTKLENLKTRLKELGSIAVAYSGGVDSNFLLRIAKDTLGDNVIAVTMHAMMHSNIEIEEAKEYAKSFGVKHVIVNIENFDVEEFLQNGPQRCYYCKSAVFTKVLEVAKENNIKYVADGTNLSDLGDFRPGLKALEELNIVSPLKESGLTKDDIRALSKEIGLVTHNKPAFACLATRIPYGTRINNEMLRMVEKGEQYLIELGFTQFRVRHHGEIARIEVEKAEIHKFFSNDILEKTNNKFREIGFKYTTLDMNGYSMGSMNKVIET